MFEVAICDLKAAVSSRLSWNMKSSGKRSRFRFICSTSRFVSTPYRSARSSSSRTCCPLITKIRFSIAGAGTSSSEAAVFLESAIPVRMTDGPEVIVYIGAPGFEPGTSPTRTVRATRLRHAPRGLDYPRRWGAGAGRLLPLLWAGRGFPDEDHDAQADSDPLSSAAGGDAGGRSRLPAAGLRGGLAAEPRQRRGLPADAGSGRLQRAPASLLGRGRAGEPRLLGTAVGLLRPRRADGGARRHRSLPLHHRLAAVGDHQRNRPAGRQPLAAAGLGLVPARGGAPLRRRRQLLARRRRPALP